MNILVTGSAGFIGFHLVERLVKEGHSVVGIDIINDYYDVNLKYGRLANAGIDRDKILVNKEVRSYISDNYSFYQTALEDIFFLTKIFKAKSFDVVINLAAQAGVRYSLENPQAYVSSNIAGFVNILECSQKFSIKHLIYGSSSSVYGLNTDFVFSTDDNVDHPVSLYGATKRANELMAHAYSHLYKLPTTGLRFFTVYGPWGRPDMAYFLFTKAILDNKPIDVYNNGEMMRDFTYIDDIIQGIITVIDNCPLGKQKEFDNNPLPSNSPALFEIYNIGNSKPIKLLRFIKILEKELKKHTVKNFMAMQPGDVLSTHADVTPLINLGYKPSTSLDEGVKNFVQWYKWFYHSNKSKIQDKLLLNEH